MTPTPLNFFGKVIINDSDPIELLDKWANHCFSPTPGTFGLSLGHPQLGTG
jgi:hypothetical protein